MPSAQIWTVEVDGEELVVWRGESQVICANPRRCPHLDHDLAEGFVQGDELVCVSHGWSIGCDGHVFKRNEAGREDPKGTVCTWQTREQDGKISVQSEGGTWIDVDS
jgi:phenylpropionate dioxygenase-like ring-hydroxylating dioxygenase large terminal subunit